jgi:hypothetical protein
MRRGHLRSEIEKNSYDLKKRMKNFYNLMSSFYNNERKIANTKSIFIKRNLDRVQSSYKHIDSLDFDLKTQDLENKEDEIKKLCVATYKNLKNLEQIFQDKVSEDRRLNTDVQYSNIKRNLDKVKLALENFKRFDTSMNLTKKDWDQIDQRFEER